MVLTRQLVAVFLFAVAFTSFNGFSQSLENVRFIPGLTPANRAGKPIQITVTSCESSSSADYIELAKECYRYWMNDFQRSISCDFRSGKSQEFIRHPEQLIIEFRCIQSGFSTQHGQPRTFRVQWKNGQVIAEEITIQND